MKQHWLKFYTSDWRGDISLGPCSLAARGLWMELLCIMGEAEPRGSLLRDGKQFTIKQIAAVARCSGEEAEVLLCELETEGVFSRDEDGTIYSRRMRRDVEKAEKDKANGRTGGNPALIDTDKAADNRGVNPNDNPTDKAKKLEARSQNLEKKIKTREALEFFEIAWAAYPKRDGSNPKKPAEEKFVRLVLEGENPGLICEGVRSYAATRIGQDAKYTKQFIVFLNQHVWKDDHSPIREGPYLVKPARKYIEI